MTVTATVAWYDSHENLYTLAEWIRKNNGWQFWKDAAIDILEKPWKWEPEWRLASGSVSFVEVKQPRDPADEPLDGRYSTDATNCHWCDAPVGLVSYESEFGPEVEWRTTYIDTVSEDLACDECAGQAANFVTRDNADGMPVVTPELREHFKAFGHTEVFPVVIVHDVTTRLGNVLVPVDTRTWGARNTDPEFSPGSISVWTAHTHYAGCKTSSIPAGTFVRIAGETVRL